jgi:rhamnulokinase
MKYFLAIDIGASSGRHIVGWRSNKKIVTDEVYRFENGVKKQDGHLIWDICHLVTEVKNGITKAQEKYSEIESLSIDTWGVDYVLMNGEEEILPCYSYRDNRTEAVIPMVHNKFPFDRAYRHTGIQFQPFNTVYQLYADKLDGRLDKATDFLMIPEYLLYKLCGVKSHEYTNATTTGMVNVWKGAYDERMIESLSLPHGLFNPLQQPGTVIGKYHGIKCVLCASHDTASAVEGIEMQGNAPYISSGTWSLLGVKAKTAITSVASEAANWSNEGGVGYVRYQKNIMGMWLVNRLRSELCPDKEFSEIVNEAENSTYKETVDANAPVFMSPESMKDAFDSQLVERPQSIGDYFCCAYLSLALSYKNAVEELEKNTGMFFDKIYIVGGGAKNAFLNRMTAYMTKKRVVALPIEATAIGNLKIQMEAAKC